MQTNLIRYFDNQYSLFNVLGVKQNKKKDMIDLGVEPEAAIKMVENEIDYNESLHTKQL